MTEQINTKIENKFFYETSTITYDNHIYYFKRIYDTQEAMSESDKSETENNDGSNSTEMSSTSFL